jgi:hypothetical protein
MNEIEEVELTRKRGRPKGSFRVKKKIDNSRYNKDSDSDERNDKYNKNQSYLLSRRSRRNKLVDPNKEIIVIWPDEDPIVRLGVLSHEIPEFIVSMEEQNELEEEYDEDNNNYNNNNNNNSSKKSSNNDHIEETSILLSSSSSSSSSLSSSSLPNVIEVYVPRSTPFIAKEESKIEIEAGNPRIQKKKTKISSEKIIDQDKSIELLKNDTYNAFKKGS